jgi:Fur family ferric uptake transcriptional regulator/Fur family peroxide stress response transcriptional regulator
MTSVKKVNSDEELTALLRARGQRITPQRLVIHRVLRQRDRHLSAEDVREAVKHDLPGTSTPTVYATLDLLADLGLVRRIHVGAGPTLYDARTDAHHHTICTNCRRVEDLDAAADLSTLVRAARSTGFDPVQIDLSVSGLCAACSAAEPGDSPSSR